MVLDVADYQRAVVDALPVTRWPCAWWLLTLAAQRAFTAACCLLAFNGPV